MSRIVAVLQRVFAPGGAEFARSMCRLRWECLARGAGVHPVRRGLLLVVAVACGASRAVALARRSGRCWPGLGTWQRAVHLRSCSDGRPGG